MSKSKNKEIILVVDDVAETREVIQRNLLSKNYKVLTASGAKEAIGILESTQINLVITDWQMPEVSGHELIRHIKENYHNIKVIMITGYATIKGAVDALKCGAEEYLSKPFTNEELFNAVNNVLSQSLKQELFSENIIDSQFSSYGLIGDSPGMNEVYRMISKVSLSSANILVSGESGTGKELVARAIHYCSPRSSAPFVTVNCGAIPENLFESELFGYVKGAFTGAMETRAGFFQTADGVTIFLDEISETSFAMQVKLLRVIQEKEVNMVGANKTTKVDIRIVAATNKDLAESVKKGKFREDLYFRLNVINIKIPPLRNRRNDILLLANHFAKKFADEFGHKTPRFSDNAINALLNYYWPGNIRELENLIQSLVVLTDSNILDVLDFPSFMRYSISNESDLTKTLAEVENEHIKKVLAITNNNKTKAAKILGIDRKTLRGKLSD